uniref:WAP domain-containing protein n=1 Tax=Pyxicephalus adspersus TaxID=30357 RepID=A0AAV3AKB9_PYXAD|nr:TPA: hypothetical protein GDO54_008258 [Pyxicephalus adspersus]
MNSMQVSFLLLSLTTLTTGSDVKPGACPPERFLYYQNYPVQNFCQNDKDCSGDQKCCVDNKFMFCKQPAGERSGSCPSTNTLISPRCNDDCIFDSDCPSEKKCCSIGCGKRCLRLVRERSGKCPTSIPNVSETGTKDQNCASDYDCGIGYKCCGTQGNKKCLRAE